MKIVCGLLILLLSCFIKPSAQFTSGAGIGACVTLLPNHPGYQPQDTESPYKLTTDIQYNGNVVIRIQAIDASLFAGFLIQGRSVGNDQPVGSFNVPDGVTNYRTISCEADSDSATHTSATLKSELEILWIPPIGFSGQIYFTGAVVQSFPVFWGGIRSTIVDVTDNSDEIYGKCDGTRNCYGSPPDCVESRDCDAVAVVHMNGGVFQFEMKTGPTSETFKNPKYIAFGISNSQTMADISVIECEVGNNGEISAYTSYTEIVNRGSPRTDIQQEIIRLINSSYSDDVIHCIIERDTVTTVHGREYNLLKDLYYVHLVVGSTLRDNQIGYHDLTKTTTKELDFVHYVESSADPIYDNCGGESVCFGTPIGCINRRICNAVVVVHYTVEKFQFELKTMVVSETQPPAYIAFGISDEPSMADISVIECTVDNSVIHGFTSQTEITDTGRGAPRSDISQDVVRLIESTYIDGQIHCLIERDTVSTVRGRVYDLLNEQYYLHVAVGSRLRENSVDFHNLHRDSSIEKVSLYQTVPKPPAANEIYDGCGVTKGCFGHPPNCVDTFDCLAVTSINFVNNVFQFEMLADTRNTPRFVVFGLSETTGMGDASVIECVVENDAINAYTSYTQISPSASPRTNIPQNIIRLVHGTYEDGLIHCIVERDTISEVRGQTFNLMDIKYYLLIASGTSVLTDSINTHDRGQLISASRQSLFDLTFTAASTASIKVHGIFMIVAWVGTSTIGIVFARYFKKTWVGSQMCGKDQWFVWHRICMICTGLLTITSFIVIFIEIDGWSAEDNPHAILGTIVTGICLFQIFGALFRPPPDAKHRAYFNWGHMLGGSTVQILAVITIFFSVTLTKAELSDEFYWVMGGFCIFYLIIYTLFHIMSMMGNKQENSKGAEAPYSFLRKMMLAFFIIITVLFVVALSALIGLAPL